MDNILSQFKREMPSININALPESARQHARAICLKSGQIRKSRPNKDLLHGEAYYVWRNVVFFVGIDNAHHCMPVMADWDMRIDPLTGAKYDHDARRQRCRELDSIVDAIVSAVPKNQWAGVRRWGRVLGHIA